MLMYGSHFSNAEASGLGAPLPQGIVRVYARDSQGRAQFIGEDNIGHTPGGSDISLKIGDAFDVTVQSTIKAQNQSQPAHDRHDHGVPCAQRPA